MTRLVEGARTGAEKEGVFANGEAFCKALYKRKTEIDSLAKNLMFEFEKTERTRLKLNCH